MEGRYHLVFGGTGHYGSMVVKSLINKGVPVRVFTRNASKAKEKLGNQPDYFEGDVLNAQDIVRSLLNVRSIAVCLSAMSSKLIRQMQAIERDAVLTIMDEAQQANITRLVYMSGYEMRAELLDKLKIPEFGAIKIEIEQKISQSDFNWTILGDAPAFDIFFAFVNGSRLAIPGGGNNAIPCIAPQDVGEITAQSLLRDDLNGMRLKLTGPAAYSFPEVADLITRISGKAVKHMSIPLAGMNMVSRLLQPFNPFVRYLYKSLKMLNNFPEDLAVEVPHAHQKLLDLFDYNPLTLEEEIKARYTL